MMNKEDWCQQSPFSDGAIGPLPALLLSQCLGQAVAVTDVKL